MLGNREGLLFYGVDLSVRLREQEDKLTRLIEDLPEDQLLATPDDRLVECLNSRVEIEPLVIYEDRMTMEQHETKIDVSASRERNPFGDRGPIYVHGLAVTVSIPYTGQTDLWKCKPDQWQAVRPHGSTERIYGGGMGSLNLFFEIPSDEGPERIKSKLDREMKSIRFYLQAQATQVTAFNNAIPSRMLQLARHRRERLMVLNQIPALLGIPLKRNASAPPVDLLPMKKKLVKPLPLAPEGGYKPEPGIAMDDYEYVLKVIRHEGRTFETTPRTYALHDEEGLRDIVLAHLNGHYDGGATGETFRRSGKTDIRIEDHSRSAFVAECKVWRGQKELSAALDQLLAYLTWRDCKAAILVFNKHNSGFSEIVAKVPEVFLSHPKHRKDLGTRGDGEWRYVFASQEDDLREILVHIFLFNLYVAAS